MSNPYAVGSVNDSAAVPTMVRHRMVLLATVAAILLYLDRICMSTAAFAVAAIGVNASKPLVADK